MSQQNELANTDACLPPFVSDPWCITCWLTLTAIAYPAVWLELKHW